MDGNIFRILGQKNIKKKRIKQSKLYEVLHAFFLEFLNKYFSVFVSVTH